MRRQTVKGQAGFTLIELLAVMAILGVLAALVAGTVVGLGNRSQSVRLDGDQTSISKAVNAFALEAFPEKFPIVAIGGGVTGNIAGIHEINFKTGLPQDPNKVFVPDFLSSLPDSSALVSWRMDTNSGNVFFAQDGSALIKPSNNRLDISVHPTTGSSSPSATSDYLLELSMAKDEAAPEIVKISIPAGYTLAGALASAGTLVGKLQVTLDTDNNVDPGQTIRFGGVVLTTSDPDQWVLVVDYNNYDSTGSATLSGGFRVKPANEATRVHTIDVVRPSSDSGGTLTLTIARGTDKEANKATEKWDMTLVGLATEKTQSYTVPSNSTSSEGGGVDANVSEANGFVPTGTNVTSTSSITIIANPGKSAVFRWSAEEHSTIDPVVGDTLFFVVLPGSQGVLIK